MLELTELMITLIGLAFAGLSGVIGWAAKKIGDRFGLEADHELSVMLEEVIDAGIRYARRRLEKMAKDKGQVEFTDNDLIETVLEYVIEGAPDALRYFGLTEDRVRKLVEARLDD